MALVTQFSKKIENECNPNNYQDLQFSMRENGDVLCLTASLKNKNYKRTFFGVKLKNYEHFEENEDKWARTFGHVFSLQDEAGQVFLCFEANSVVFPPEKNNFNILSQVLKQLAQLQTDNVKKINLGSNGFDIKSIAAEIVSSHFDASLVDDTVAKLQDAVDDLLKNNNYFVKSFATLSSNNVFLKSSEGSIIIDCGSEIYCSPAYDALIIIFSLSTESFRQHHLKKLLSKYYKSLQLNFHNNFDINVFERHLKIFLPIVKFQMAAINKNSPETQDLMKNLSYYFKYPQINYEDCLEAVSKKLDTTEFDLIGYQLVPLDQKNGHLGEYYSLKATVKMSYKVLELSMFTKVLTMDNNPGIKAIVQSGPSEKEQFFYRVFLPELQQHGLGSLLDFCPGCYFDRLNEVIIMEDLVEQNFKTVMPSDKMDYDSLKTMVDNCVKLHASSLLLEEKLSKIEGRQIKLGQIYSDYLSDWIVCEPGGVSKTQIGPSLSKPGIMRLIEIFEDLFQEMTVEKFKAQVDDLFTDICGKINSPPNFTCVTGHGDAYCSNFLIRYDSKGIAIDSKLVDFQNLRYSPPVFDILFLIYTSTKKEVRSKYQEKVLKYYYEQLKGVLANFGLDMDKVLPLSEYEDSIRALEPLAICVALFYLQVIAAPEKKRREIYFDSEKHRYYFIENRREYIDYMMGISEEFKVCMQDIIEDLYRVCSKI